MSPNDFYFAYQLSQWSDEEFGKIYDWVVTPKVLWDSNRCYSDQSEADTLVQPFGLERSMESCYESECDDPEVTRRKLEAAGFIYNADLLRV